MNHRPTPSPDLGFLFVVAYGRSGSTLLQGILNSIPGYLIRGENWEVLRHLHEFDRVSAEGRRKLRRKQRRAGADVGRSAPTSPFYGMDAFPQKVARAGIRQLALDTLLRPDHTTRVTGFKEIRWADGDVADHVGWLRTVFPGARFLVNTRDLDSVAHSKWWANAPDARAQLEEIERRLFAAVAPLGSDAFHLHYDDYVADPAALAPLFAWLGEELDVEGVRRVMSVAHSY